MSDSQKEKLQIVVQLSGYLFLKKLFDVGGKVLFFVGKW